MTLHQRARLFNAWIVKDARDEHGLICHRLIWPERRPIAVPRGVPVDLVCGTGHARISYVQPGRLVRGP